MYCSSFPHCRQDLEGGAERAGEARPHITHNLSLSLSLSIHYIYIYICMYVCMCV